jgi:hypothetical protein
VEHCWDGAKASSIPKRAEEGRADAATNCLRLDDTLAASARRLAYVGK